MIAPNRDLLEGSGGAVDRTQVLSLQPARSLPSMEVEICSGWLLKSGKHMAWNVKRRWVVLDRSALTWYINPGDSVFSGSLPLTAILGGQLSAKLKRQSCFEVMNRSPTKIFFIATDQADALRWIDAIEEQLQLAQLARSHPVGMPGKLQTIESGQLPTLAELGSGSLPHLVPPGGQTGSLPIPAGSATI